VERLFDPPEYMARSTRRFYGRGIDR